MGQTLSEPVTTKESCTVQNSNFMVGSSCMQGWRVTMEDAHTHILSLPDDKSAAFFAVYDGHGGSKVAQHAGNHLHKHIVQRQDYQDGDITTAIKQGFLEFDHSMQTDEAMKEEMAGTTAVTVLIKDKKLYCGNVGDSRSVASIGGKVVPLSNDHKPNNPEESARINKAGGWVEYNRVNGNLALSRALGDFVFKRNTDMKAEEQMVSALPEVEIKDITEEWEFIVLACDGIWDVMSNEEVVEFVRRRLSSEMVPEAICEELMSNCLAPDCQMGGLGCDNMTVILACFLNGKSYKEFCQQVAESYKSQLNGKLNNGNLEDSGDQSTLNNAQEAHEEGDGSLQDDEGSVDLC